MLQDTLAGLSRRHWPELWLTWQLYRHARRPEAELQLLPELVAPDRAAVDVGAHFGLYTQPLARLAKTVHAFEPLPEMANVLRRTSAGNVTVHEVALASQQGDAELHVPWESGRPSFGLASLRLEPDSLPPALILKVSAARLDDLVAEPVGFLKIDVEGAELDVLFGASGILERDRPRVLIEAEDRHRAGATSSVFQFFEERGYTGEFLLNGIRKSISEFDLSSMQDVNCLEKHSEIYVNNFIFHPRG